MKVIIRNKLHQRGKEKFKYKLELSLEVHFEIVELLKKFKVNLRADP